jgi:uncharacterized protein (DUF1800 family)
MDRIDVALTTAAGAALAAAGAAPANAALVDDDIRHLLSRTGFGPTPAELSSFAGLSFAQAVDRILGDMRTKAAQPLPPFTSESIADLAQLRREQRAPAGSAASSGRPPPIQPKIVKVIVEQAIAAKAWWYEELLNTPSPFTERMVLFWHNHFVSAVRKVRYVPALLRQNELFRREAAGNFARLLHEVTRDPAMLIYLDGATSRRNQPNENFARELMELFTLGEGNYSEQDIKQAARAFTGNSLDRQTGLFRFYPALHDDGVKTVFGQSGAFDGDQIVDLLLRNPRTAEFVVAKLWREFVSLAPDEREIKRLAGLFRAGNYELKPLLRELLLSAAFRDPKNRGVLFKSPVELVVGTVRLLQLPVENKAKLIAASRVLGQDLFDPPNVKGWPGGEAWITTYTLVQRRQILQRVVQATQVAMFDRQMKIAADKQQMMESPIEGRSLRNVPMAIKVPDGFARIDVASLQKVMLPAPPLEPLEPSLELGQAMAQLMLDPVYQLK